MNIDRARQRLFDRQCRAVEVRETVYHGTPLEGLLEIKKSGRVRPQSHGILPGDWFCVSTNDNMLRAFSDGDGLTGFVFAPPALHCVELDWMHTALACAENMNMEPDWLAKASDPDKERNLAYRLGYHDCRGDLAMEECEFRRLLPSGCDGIIFPWGHYARSWNDEAEIALTDEGCRKVWNHIRQIVIEGEWLDPDEGWRELIRALAKRRRPQAA